MESLLATANIFGQMEVFSKAIFSMAYEMVMARGSEDQETLTNIKDTI